MEICRLHLLDLARILAPTYCIFATSRWATVWKILLIREYTRVIILSVMDEMELSAQTTCKEPIIKNYRYRINFTSSTVIISG